MCFHKCCIFFPFPTQVFFFFVVVMGLLGRCESCTVSVFMAAQVLAVSDCKKNKLFVHPDIFFLTPLFKA